MAVSGVLLAAFGAKEALGWSADLVESAADLLFDGAGRSVLDGVQGRLRGYLGHIPANHDLENALRLVALTSTVVVLKCYSRAEEADRFDNRASQPPPFIGAAETWLRQALGIGGTLKIKTNADLVRDLEAELDTALTTHNVDALRTALQASETEMWRELTEGATAHGGGTAPADFAALFRGEIVGKPGWSLIVQAFMREAMKKNPRALVAFVTSRLAYLRNDLAGLSTKLDATLDGIGALRQGQETLLLGQEAMARDTAAAQAEAERRHAEAMAATAANQAQLDRMAAAIEREKGVPLPVIEAILTGFGHTEALADPPRAEQVLRAKADEYIALRDRLNRLTNDDPKVQALRQRAAAALAAGGFAEADQFLAEAERRDLDVVEELETLAIRRRLSAAESRAERGAAARLQLDYRGAASHYAEAAAIVPATHAAERWRYTVYRALALYVQGREFGDNPALLDGIAAFQTALGLAPRDRVPLDWATTQNNLGIALATLGARESGTARLDQAVGAYRAALLEWTRDRVPLDWAATQNNLGNALATLGARESGTARLNQAVEAYRAALLERTRDRVPLDWAMTQNNLGLALQTLGARESGTARLDQAVEAYRAALLEWTRDRVPLDWAMTQNNLGGALATLGERESGTARLDQAVEAYRAALLERTRDRVPLDWAHSQYNLANTLALLAERSGDRGTLEEAIACMRDAAEVYRQGNVTYWLPIAERRVREMEAALAAMPR